MPDYKAIGARVASQYGDALCAFTAGSIIEGFGNATSDLDLFVVGRSEPGPSAWNAVGSFTFGEASIDVGYEEDDLRVDVELWSIHSIRSIADEISRTPLTRSAAASLDERRLQTAHALRIGQSVKGENLFAELQESFDFRHLASLLALRFVGDYAGFAEDAVGAIQDDDGGTALLGSRAALGASVDAYLAAKGLTNPKTKWRFAKLRLMSEETLLSDYLRLECQPADDSVSLIALAKERLRFAGALADRAALLAVPEHSD